MPRRTIKTNDQVHIIKLPKEGLSTREVAQRVHQSQSDVVRTRNLFQLTGSVEDLHRTGWSISTTFESKRTEGWVLQIWIQRSKRLQNVTYRDKLLGEDCLMQICIPNDHGEHHVVHHTTMDSGTDGQGIMQNGCPSIGVGCCLRMKLESVCILMIADMFGDNPLISNASNTVSHKCNKVVVEWCSEVALHGVTVHLSWLLKTISLLYSTRARFCNQ